MRKVPVSDTRIKSLDSTSLFVAEAFAAIAHANTGAEIQIWFDCMFPVIWRRYLRTQATHAQLN